MSSDEDEFASNFDATTTPFRSVKLADADLKATAKPNGRPAVAGPSSKPATARRTQRKRSPSLEEVDDDAERADASEGDDGAVVEVVPPPKRGRPKRAASREPEPTAATKLKAVQRGKGKGKAKAEAVRDASPEVMDVDNLEMITEVEEDEGEAQPIPNPQLLRKPKGRQASNGETAWKKQEERLRKQLDHLQKQLELAKSRQSQIAGQLDELVHARHTEPEELLQQQQIHYESRIQTQEEMIQELSSQLARVDSLTREGKTSTLHFLTREAADEERRGVERQVEQLKAALKEKEKAIAERDKALQEQIEINRTLQSDLNAEIERSKALASRSNIRDPPSSVTKGRKLPLGALKDDPKNGLVLRLYEDMTNFLVINMKYEEVADSDEEQWILNCIYTHAPSGQSLNFQLRFYTEIVDKVKEEKVVYTAMQMDKEPQEVIDRLDYLAGQFSFRRTQVDAFLEKLSSSMNTLFGDGDDMVED